LNHKRFTAVGQLDANGVYFSEVCFAHVKAKADIVGASEGNPEAEVRDMSGVYHETVLHFG